MRVRILPAPFIKECPRIKQKPFSLTRLSLFQPRQRANPSRSAGNTIVYTIQLDITKWESPGMKKISPLDIRRDQGDKVMLCVSHWSLFST